MTRKNYIPGFDWVRLIGSTLVMASHCGAFQYYSDHYPVLVSILSTFVPVFFLMSGYLSGRRFSKERIKKQVIKYGSIYMLVEIAVHLHVYFEAFLKTGHFDFAHFALRILKRLVYRSVYSGHLWFMPVLLYSLIINAFLNSKKRRALIAVSLVLLILIRVDDGKVLLAACEKLRSVSPLLEGESYNNSLLSIVQDYLTGLIYTTTGFELVNRRIKATHLLLLLLPSVLFDLTVKYTGVSTLLLSILIFLLVKKLPGSFLFPYHTENSIYAGVTYFLHIVEKSMINHVSNSIFLNILAITAFNLLITAIASVWLRKRKGGTHELQQSIETSSG